MAKWDCVINLTIEADTFGKAESAIYTKLNEIEGVDKETAEIVESFDSDEEI